MSSEGAFEGVFLSSEGAFEGVFLCLLKVPLKAFSYVF